MLLAIIVLIVGMLFLRGGAQKDISVVNDVVAMQKDLTDAIKEFQTQYHYLPGDLPNAGRKLGEIPAICNFPLLTNDIGNGLVDNNSESECVPEELKQSGLLNVKLKADKLHVLITSNGNQLTVLSPSIAHVPNMSSAPLSPLNVIEVANLPCDSARAIDKKLDDGNLGTGNVRVAPAFVNCTSDAVVPYLDIAF